MANAVAADEGDVLRFVEAESEHGRTLIAARPGLAVRRGPSTGTIGTLALVSDHRSTCPRAYRPRCSQPRPPSDARRSRGGPRAARVGTAGRRRRGGRGVAPVPRRVGRHSAIWVATRSSGTPPIGSATTVGSTPCGPTDGAGAGTSAGPSRRTVVSCGRCGVSARWPRRSARPTRRSDATCSCSSSTRLASRRSMTERDRSPSPAVTLAGAVLTGGSSTRMGTRQGIVRDRRRSRWRSGSPRDAIRRMCTDRVRRRRSARARSARRAPGPRHRARRRPGRRCGVGDQRRRGDRPAVELVVIASCDLPFLSRGPAAGRSSRRSGSPVAAAIDVVVATNRPVQPLCALWRSSTLPVIDRRLRIGRSLGVRSPRSAARARGAGRARPACAT